MPDLPAPAETRDLVLGLHLESIKEKDYLTHNFHPYPAKFVPQIAAAAIQKFSSPGDTVVDTFCGSGTTLVEASLQGRPSYGSDTNPIACMVASAKTARLTDDNVTCLREHLRALQNKYFEESTAGAFGLSITETEIPTFRNRDHWFEKNVQRELTAILKSARELQPDQVRNFALTAFSSILVRVSNQESETRWAAVKKSIAPGEVTRLYVNKLEDMLERSILYRGLASAEVHVTIADARKLDYLGDERANLMVTSPPYMNSFDYYLYHKLRFFWLGFDNKLAQSLEIGSRNRHCDQKEDISSYFASIGESLAEMHRVLRRNGHLVILMGDAVYRGQFVDMGKSTTALAENSGFRLVETFHFDQRKYSRAFPRFARLSHQFTKLSHLIVFRRH
jgi:site-specific DNA-methyltransferase (cytosine-N4-specific)